MKPQLLLAASALLFASCSTQSKHDPVPTPTMAVATGKDLGRLQRGHALYMSHCSRCHEAQLPDSVSREDWHVVVPGMAWNAGLKKSDEQAILDYILAAKGEK